MTRGRAAITVVFFVDGALFASWASRIPALADRTGASTGALGVALIAPALGALIAMPQVGRVLHDRSSRTCCAVALAALMVAIVLPALAPSVVALAITLILVGAAYGSLDVAMNAHGVGVERDMARPILSSLHAAFSFGGFAGAGLGALAAAGAVTPLSHLLAAAALFGVPGLVAVGALQPSEQHLDASAPRRALRRLPLPLILLGAAAFCSLLAEGAASNWSAKLISGPMHGSQALGAAAYAVFSVAMGSGRLVADRLWARWGAVGLLRRASTVAAVGFAGGLAIGTPIAALAGFALLGLGLSGTVPTLYRAAAGRTAVPTGAAIAAVSSLGYFGFLAGPPVIGGLAQLAGLQLAIGVITVAATLVAVLAPAAASAPRSRPLKQDAPPIAHLQ